MSTHYEKYFRRLIYLWPLLINPNNYVIPKTVEEFKQLGGIFPAKITINSTDYYFTNKLKRALREFIDVLYNLNDIQATVSFEFAHKTTKSFIEMSISDQLINSRKPRPEKEVKKIIKTLSLRRTVFQFYRVIDGIELKDMQSISFGDVDLLNFSKKNMLAINKYREHNNINGFYDSYAGPFIRKNILNKICIKAIGKGDEIKAAEMAMKKIRGIISMLRFIVAILAYDRVHENRVKINLHGESYNIGDSSFRINNHDQIISLNYEASRKALQKLPLDLEMIADLKKYYFFDDWLYILSKQGKTELEEAILTAIYWIGEGQDDFSYESAFIKYWTALEALFSISDEGKKSMQCPNCRNHIETSIPDDGITKSLASGVAILTAFGGYRFVETGDVKKIISIITRLYRKRSKIIHRGSFGHVTSIELSEICKYSVWCVLTCFGLRSQGYETLKQIKEKTKRLHSLSQGRNQ